MQTTRIGEGILRLRKQAGLSQEELGAKLGVSRQAVSKWESGAAMPSIDNIIELANIFQVDTDTLLQLQQPHRDAGLTPETVGAIVDELSQRWNQRVTRQSRFLAAAVIVLAVVIAICIVSFSKNTSHLASMQQDAADRLQILNTRVNGISSEIQSQISLSINSALQEEHAILVDSHCSTSYEYETDSAVVRMKAYPMETRPGETASFSVVSQAEKTYTAPGVYADNHYSAELRVPADEADTMSVYVTLEQDGQKRTEKIDYLYYQLELLRVQICSDTLNDYFIEGSKISIRPFVEIANVYDRTYSYIAVYAESVAISFYDENTLLESVNLVSESFGDALPAPDGIGTASASSYSYWKYDGDDLEFDWPIKDFRIEVTVTDNLNQVFTKELTLA